MTNDVDSLFPELGIHIDCDECGGESISSALSRAGNNHGLTIEMMEGLHPDHDLPVSGEIRSQYLTLTFEDEYEAGFRIS